MNNLNEYKSKLKKFIDENVRFSIKAKITLSCSIIFIILSILSTISMVSLFIIANKNLGYDIYFELLVIISLFKFLEFLVNTMFSYKISKHSLKPVDDMIKEVKEISINDLNKRLDVSGVNNEFKDLAKTFNEMVSEIQVSMEKQNRFISDASHELRTPISVIQGYANLLSRWGKEDEEVLIESIEAIKDESNNMKKLIESLLFLARGEKNNNVIIKEDFNLKNLVDEIVKESIMIDNKHNIFTKNNEDVIINADKNLIKEAIRVFVDNSIKYTQEDGNIKINSFKSNKKVFISIEDNGIGIPKDDLERIFDRFYRVDKSRNKEINGFGLGLSIAKYIIDTHDGNIKIYSKSKEDCLEEDVETGTIVFIELPILESEVEVEKNTK